MKRMDRIYVMELVRAFQCGQISRRDFLRRATAALGSTSAAAMLLAACRQPTAGTPPPDVVTPSPTGTSPAAAEPTSTPAATAEPSPARPQRPLRRQMWRPEPSSIRIPTGRP